MAPPDSAPPAQYLATLKAEVEKKRALRARYDRFEQRLAERRAALDEQILRYEFLASHYAHWLADMGMGPPPTAKIPLPPVPAPLFAQAQTHLWVQAKNRVVHPADQVRGGQLDGITLRVGPQRLHILQKVAEATREGRSLTNRDIAEATVYASARISNVLFADIRRGFLKREGDKVSMTEKGFEFLRLVASGDAPADSETPADPARSTGVGSSVV